jgi:hypothetical protein
MRNFDELVNSLFQPETCPLSLNLPLAISQRFSPLAVNE